MNRDFADLLRSFDRCGVEYLVVGGYAVMAYAEPRFTKELDVWIRPTLENAERTWRALAEFGAPVEGVSIQDLATPGLVYQVGVAPIRVDVLMSVDGLDFEDAWPRRVRLDFGGVEGWMIAKEDLVTQTEEWGTWTSPPAGSEKPRPSPFTEST